MICAVLSLILSSKRGFSRFLISDGPPRAGILFAGALIVAGCSGSRAPADEMPPGREYFFYVAAESDDTVALIRFDGKNAFLEKSIPVGSWPVEIEGPHGVTVSPDGEYWFVSLAHGLPSGKVLKYETGSDEFVGEVGVGLFPATMEMSAATGLLYVVNFNLHGRPSETSDLSVIEPETMTEIARVEHGIMPHGSRISPDGLRHYSVAMMSGELWELDATTLEVTRRMDLNLGGAKTKPTWVQPHPRKPLLYVALNGADEVLEINIDDWEITRHFVTDKAPYNLDVSSDGRLLVVSYKGAAKIGIWDLHTGEELARLENSRRVSHGVIISPDSRFAFISVEGVGGEPGAVDVFDLRKLVRISSVDIGKQAGGMYFWKMTG